MEEVIKAAGHGGLEAYFAIRLGVDEGEVGGVEGEAVGGFVGGAVEGVGEDGVGVGFELYANLVFSAGVEFAAEVGDFLFGVDVHGGVGEDGEFALADVLGDVDLAGEGVFEQQVFEFSFGFSGDAVDDGVVAAGDGVLEELFLEGAEGVPGSGEDEEAGGVTVEAVDEVDLVFGVLFLEIFGEEFCDVRAFFLGVGGGEEAGGFVDDEDVGIEVEDLEAVLEGGGLRAAAPMSVTSTLSESEMGCLKECARVPLMRMRLAVSISRRVVFLAWGKRRERADMRVCVSMRGLYGESRWWSLRDFI